MLLSHAATYEFYELQKQLYRSIINRKKILKKLLKIMHAESKSSIKYNDFQLS